MSENLAPHRRAEDLNPESIRSEADRRAKAPGGMERRKPLSQEFFRKFRQPLIGLGLAGIATPMIRSQQDAPEPVAPDESSSLSIAPTQPTDLEEHLAEQIGLASAESDQEVAIASAVDRYRIDRVLAEKIYKNAVENEIEPQLAYGLVKTESAFKHKAISHVGARGLTQVMPRTANWLKKGTKAEDLYNEDTNLHLGFRYLRQLINKYEGDVKLALLAYNRGPGTVDKVLRKGGNPDNGYAKKVIDG